MDLYIKRLLNLLILLNISGSVISQIITIKQPEFAFKKIEFASSYGDDIFQIKDITLNESGFGLIHNDLSESGLYYIFFNDSTALDVLYDADDKGKITINYIKETGVYEISGPDATTIYNTYQNELKLHLAEQSVQDKRNKSQKKNKTENANLTSRINFNNYKDSLIDLTINKTKSPFVKAYLKAQRNISIPDFTPPENIIFKDSVIWTNKLNYYKKHYLDNVDLANHHLIHTPIYTQKVNTYLDQIVNQKPEDLCNTIDFLLEKSGTDSICHQFLLTYLLKKYEQNKNNATDEFVYLYIIRKYFLQSANRKISDRDLSILNREYTRRKPSSIGETAPDIRLTDMQNSEISLSGIKAEYILLYFMSYDCPICNKVTPEIRKIVTRFNYLDLKVVTVCVGENRDNWKTYISDKGISNWINLLGDEQMNRIAPKYNLSYTPTLFLLDKEKKILNKNLNVKQLEEELLQIAIEKNK